MLGSLSLTPQPTARQTREIVFRLGHELTARGIRVSHDVIGGFRFRMSLPWHHQPLGVLRAISAGEVSIGAGSGEPWRVRYELRFTWLLILALALSVVLIDLGLHWPRARLIDLLVAVWVVVSVPCVLAWRHFRRLVREAARSVVSGGDEVTR